MQSRFIKTEIFAVKLNLFWMDFLDSIDTQVTQPASKRACRVRSWYLYEQYKSLEKNQLDAAKKLKNRSQQDRILQRELSERRARRQYSEQFDHRQSESHTARSIQSDASRTLFSESTASFFESVCDKEDIVGGGGPDTLSQQSEKSTFSDEYKSYDDKFGNDSCNESINSVIEKTNDNKNVADDIKQELEFVKKNIAEIINLQREAENECIEKYTQLCDKENISDNESELRLETNSLRNPCCKSATVVDKFSPKYENAILVIWSKVVSFAYNMMQNNRGNCYYDYSTQLLIAVLACDVLRRGISRMCHILQPYVSPIKFVNDDSDTSDIDEILTLDGASKSTRKIIDHKYYSRPKLKFIEKPRYSERKYHSEERWHSCKYSFENRLNLLKDCGVSEPCHRVRRNSREKNFTKEKSLDGYRNKCSCSYKCPHLKKAVNPIIKLSNYLDMILQEIQD